MNDAGLSFTPDVGDGRLGISVAKDGATFSVSLDGTGTITLGAAGVPVITIPKDFSLNFGAVTYTGIPLTGSIHGDGVNDIQSALVNGSQIALTTNGLIGANLNFGGVPLNNVTLSGAVILDPLSNTLTFGQGSTLGVDLGTRHIDIMATDNAGGQLILGANGLTFKSAGGDGGLILSVTDGGVTRQASLSFAGEMTYSLDGSINLAQGTGVNNIFADGEILTITANTDASGTMRLSTEGGLSVTSATPDALSLSLASVAKARTLYLTEITGTVTYKSGDVILSDGTSVVGSYNAQASTGGTTFKSEGGEGIIRINSDGLTLISEDVARVSVVNERNHGCYVNYGKATLKASTSQFSISEGSNVEISNPRFPVVLEAAGNYKLNGMNVITTEDNVQVRLVDYNTVVVGEFAYTPLNSTAAIAIGDMGVVGFNDGVLVSPVALMTSADLAGDFLPNYTNDFANALQIVDAGTFDALNEILPAENLGEVSFGTQANETQNPQIVIAPEK